MSDIRDLLAGQAQIGPVKFWATRATQQPTPRRIVQYIGVGVTGASLEDLGENARTEIMNGIVDENIYNDLLKVKRAAKVVTIAHPLFGVFEGRLVDVTYEAGPDDMVDIACTCVEDGDSIGLFVTAVVTTAQKKQSADSIFNDMDLGELDDFPSSTGLPSAGSGLSSGYASFSAVMDSIESADALWTDASAAFVDLAEAGNAVIDAIDGYAASTQSMIDLVDSTYELLDVARDWVDSVQNQVGSVWQNLKVTSPVSVAEVALELIGEDTEDVIDLILDRNPTLIDINAIPVGFQLSVPVAA
jgi:hypothetical protein